MSMVKVEVLPWLSQTLGAKRSETLLREEPMADGATVGDLLNKLAQDHPRFRELVFDSSSHRLSGQVSIIVNDRILELLQGLDTKLSHGDVIVLLPAFAGGGKETRCLLLAGMQASYFGSI